MDQYQYGVLQYNPKEDCWEFGGPELRIGHRGDDGIILLNQLGQEGWCVRELLDGPNDTVLFFLERVQEDEMKKETAMTTPS